MDPNPSRLEENLAALSKEIKALVNFSNTLPRKKALEMKDWQEQVRDIERDYDALQNDASELQKSRTGFLKTNLNTRRDLNSKAAGIYKTVAVLKVVGNAVSKTIEKLFSNLSGGQVKQFSHANLQNCTSNFSTKIDIEHNGNLFKGKFSNQEVVVVKVLTEDEAAEDKFVAELKTMSNTSHRNLVKLYGYCFENGPKGKKALVFEYMPNGSLDNILFNNHHGKVTWEKLYTIAIKTAKGLSYLHDGCDKQIVHRDVRTSNILLDSQFSPKITNFGVTKLMDVSVTRFALSTFRKNSDYSAPEMSYASDVTCKCDVFSFGMVLFEILGRRKNIQGKVHYPKQYWKMFDEEEIEELLMECNIAEENWRQATLLCIVAFWCIQYTPESRPSMSTVVKMLEEKMQVKKPPNPFVSKAPTKSYIKAVYKDSD